MTAPAARATRTRRVVRPRRNPGRTLYRELTRRCEPVQIEQLTDLELLRIVIPEEAARSVDEYLRPHGGLRAFMRLGESGPRAMLHLAGVDESTAARLLVLWELSARITEEFRGS